MIILLLLLAYVIVSLVCCYFIVEENETPEAFLIITLIWPIFLCIYLLKLSSVALKALILLLRKRIGKGRK